MDKEVTAPPVNDGASPPLGGSNSPPTDYKAIEIDYHAQTDYIGKSGLDLVNRSPLHYWERYLNPNRVWKPDTPAQIFGSLVHTVVFEPEKVAHRYVVVPPEMNKRKKEWEDFKEANAGKRIIDHDDMEAARRMLAAVKNHPDAGALIASAGVSEEAIFGNDPETGVLIKTKPDRFTDAGVILDLKTTTDARATPFARDIFNYRYHVQDAFYTDVATWAGREVKGFAFIAVEKEPPYAVAVYILDPESRELGRMAYRADLNAYAKCLKSGIWHAYEASAQALRLPMWAFR